MSFTPRRSISAKTVLKASRLPWMSDTKPQTVTGALSASPQEGVREAAQHVDAPDLRVEEGNDDER